MCTPNSYFFKAHVAGVQKVKAETVCGKAQGLPF